jgi:hypothetical protein
MDKAGVKDWRWKIRVEDDQGKLLVSGTGSVAPDLKTALKLMGDSLDFDDPRIAFVTVLRREIA